MRSLQVKNETNVTYEEKPAEITYILSKKMCTSVSALIKLEGGLYCEEGGGVQCTMWFSFFCLDFTKTLLY